MLNASEEAIGRKEKVDVIAVLANLRTPGIMVSVSYRSKGGRG